MTKPRDQACTWRGKSDSPTGRSEKYFTLHRMKKLRLTRYLAYPVPTSHLSLRGGGGGAATARRNDVPPLSSCFLDLEIDRYSILLASAPGIAGTPFPLERNIDIMCTAHLTGGGRVEVRMCLTGREFAIG